MFIHHSFFPDFSPPVKFEVKLRQYVDPFLTAVCHLNRCQGDSVTTGEKRRGIYPWQKLSGKNHSENLPAPMEQSMGRFLVMAKKNK